MFQVFRSPLTCVPAIALAFAACTSDSTGPSLTQDQIHTDLMAMSAKMKYLSALPNRADFGDAGKSPAKRAAGACVQEGFTVDNYLDTSAAGVTSVLDSTWSYVSVGKLICAEGDRAAFDVTHSTDENASYIAHADFRTDYEYSAGSVPLKVKLSGTGNIHYKSDYDVKVTSLTYVLDFATLQVDFSETLSFEDGRYTVVLKPTSAANSASEPGPKDVVASGSITHGTQTVGTFQMLKDDSVVIRDADGKIVEAHG
ncbi:MAG TPA: hypothetical protein VJ385_11765 [Fibrobacteria bacterium]|nr:hypothetical protein [Fibrobacteria bacterium]